MIKEEIKATVRKILAWTYHTSRLFATQLKGKAFVLTYHRILPAEVIRREVTLQAGMYVSSDVFALQMQFLREHFEVLSLAELLALWKEKNWDREKCYCVVTFDDGWLDNYLYAYPILRRYEIPATIFLPTAFIGTNRWFWPDRLAYLLKRYCMDSGVECKKNSLRSVEDRYFWFGKMDEVKNEKALDVVIEACKSRTQEEIETLLEEMGQVLGVEFPAERVLVHWGEVKEMSEHGISFGSHSCSHKIFTTLSLREVHKEVTDSLHTLQDKPINFIPVLAYPNGNYSREIINQVKAAGYQAAVSTRFGFEEHAPVRSFCIKAYWDSS